MELSAHFVRDCLDAAGELGVPSEAILAGLPALREQLAARRGRVGWNDFVEVYERIGSALGTNARIEEFGARAVALSAPAVFRHLVPHFASPRLVLQIALRFTGPAVFPSMRSGVEKLSGETLRLTLSIPAPYRGSEAFLRSCVGGIGSIPTLFGYKPALVVLSAIGPRGATYDITPPPNRTVVGRLRSAARALRGETVLFDEVARQHEAMQRVFGALLRTQSELHQLMERIPDPLMVHREGVILWANQALLTALGFASVGDVRGKRAADFVHPADRDRSFGQLAGFVADADANAKGRTLRLQAADGTLRTFETSDSQSVIFEEAPARMELARDVTERDALREQLVLADRMSQLGFLAAGVAHEINNPLAYALAALDRATTDVVAGRIDTAVRSLVTAREGAERVRGITNDLRLFARGGAQRLEPVDLSDVLRATTDLAAASIRTRGSLQVEIDQLPTVYGDAGRLGQVLMNLLVNAIDALADGDPLTNRIAVRAFTNGEGSAIVEVEDNGHGIPSDVAARIFEPFFTTKGPRSGSGLGLAICHRIVSDNGGRIEVGVSTTGTGALFRVVLPPYDGPVSSATPESRSGRRLRILVVDDEPPLASAVGRMLEDDHHLVDVVTSGEEALTRLGEGGDYDAILCDLMMAGVGGMDVYANLAAGRPGLARRLVFMTGGAFSANAQRFLDDVKNVCLDKPFTKEQVLVALNEVSVLAQTP
jgi:two-component system cell cycle sensor histidine kinase/response regulator CckA